MLRLSTLLLCAGMLLAACASGDDAAKEAETASSENMHLFLLIGQSNMAGRGIVDDASKIPHPRVFTLNRIGEWELATDPIHFDKPIAGVGPGKTFGETIAESDPSITVGLIPAAVGGSPISSWESGKLDEATNTYPYDDALIRARRAMENGELKAILWHQGESDSKPELAPIYKEKLITLIDQLRTELGNDTLPFFIGQLGQFDEWDKAKTMVDAAHKSIAEEVDNVYFISSDGMDHKGDTLHFSTAAEREFGKRYAAAYLKNSTK